MSRDISPEERLLRLIRSKSPREMSSEGEKESARKESHAAAAVVSGKIPSPVLKKEQSAHKPVLTPAKILRFENVNLILFILLIGSLIYFIPLFLKKPAAPLESLEDKLKTQEIQGSPSKAAAPQDDKKPALNYYSGEVGKRNIFSPITKEETAQQAAVEQGPTLEEIKGQVNLLGVIGGSSPQAIIEDKKTQKSYFLNKGSTFNGIEVKEIMDNKVILSYNGQEFELVL